MTPKVRNVNMKAYGVSAAAVMVGLMVFIWYMTLPDSNANEALPMPEYHADGGRTMPKFDVASPYEPPVASLPPSQPAAANPPTASRPPQVRQQNYAPQRRQVERKAMASFGFGESDMGQPNADGSAGGVMQASASSRSDAAEPSIPGYRQKRDFLKSERTDAVVRNPYQRAVSDLFLKSGILIPAKVQYPASTAQPGSIFAQVTMDIKDSATGDCVLIPAMSTLIGETNDQVSYGQSRGQAKWVRFELPGYGGYQELGSMAVTDSRGQPGYDGTVDHHYDTMALAIVGAGALSAMSSIPSMMAGNSGDVTIGMVGAGGSVNAANSIGEEIVRRELDRQNEITIEPEDEITLVTTRIIPLPAQGECNGN